MRDPFSLNNKTILVTGASSGIGREVAIAISNQGGRAIISGRDEMELNKTYEVLEYKEKHAIEAYDLMNIDGIQAWLTSIVKKYDGKLDGFVHCAGMSMLKPLFLLNHHEIDKIMKLNFQAGVELLKHAGNPKISLKGSSFVFISSVAGMMGEPGALAYCSSKAALISAAKTAAIELARFSYRVNCIAPGMVKTPMLQQYEETLGEEQMEVLKRKFPLGIGEPKDVAASSVFLLSEAARWITGTTLVVDGGYTCGK
ncbi:SDR family NAD(P)-dependent oxidoreductase [Clostridium formicaceticum]|uniref:3-oxoacyl-[acyl-carrier-protein] reductase FabG n=1 Tax=Clostridium formicaceticum TaxID=1497 RepID=A0AAC9RI79_9CLOT|nr:SDR family oxidoreductase [Clostridium formicaceticum]AOY75653.1 hypothetical protein BJL90_06945 [Clostridium formicaceticum]ARE85967.1 3-oxoacyl-[acyl-carrier-protein] reductase FabG [Clostridium formicaceticum]